MAAVHAARRADGEPPQRRWPRVTVEQIQRELLAILGRALAIRHVDAGSFPVDVVVPGCPPPPIEILRGILTAVQRRA